MWLVSLLSVARTFYDRSRSQSRPWPLLICWYHSSDSSDHFHKYKDRSNVNFTPDSLSQLSNNWIVRRLKTSKFVNVTSSAIIVVFAVVYTKDPQKCLRYLKLTIQFIWSKFTLWAVSGEFWRLVFLMATQARSTWNPLSWFSSSYWGSEIRLPRILRINVTKVSKSYQIWQGRCSL
jgi:hypothetical protein